MTSATELWNLFKNDDPVAQDVGPTETHGRLDDDSPPSVGRIAAAFAHDAQMFQSLLAGFALQQFEQVAEISWTAVKFARSAIETSTESVRSLRERRVEEVCFAPTPETPAHVEEQRPDSGPARTSRTSPIRAFPSSIAHPSSH